MGQVVSDDVCVCELNIVNCFAEKFLLIVGLEFCLALLRKWISGGVCYSPARLHRKTVLITGANTGIGKETARDMARRGARVVMACRDLTRGEKAAEEIRSSTGNSEVVVQQLDLASFASVRQFAKRYSEQEERLDILINNAGVMMCPKGLTVDGFETQFAVNHLGHFLLTNLLLGKLQKSTPSRVITVSSLAHKGGKIHFDDLSFSKTTYNSLTSYRQSKLANLLFARELARRLKGGGPHLGHPSMPMSSCPFCKACEHFALRGTDCVMSLTNI
uniref:Zgc:153441 n=1 Tax=Scleropages formosus TaxID=113540 RepID=A0A8C9RFD3_SCLFO